MDNETEEERNARLLREADTRAEQRLAEQRRAQEDEARINALVEQRIAQKKADEERAAAEAFEKSKGNFRILVKQGEELVTLTFHTAERRDHEYSRLVSSGVVALQKQDAA